METSEVIREPIDVYTITHYQDDTLRIVMIGGSWFWMRIDTNVEKSNLMAKSD